MNFKLYDDIADSLSGENRMKYRADEMNNTMTRFPSETPIGMAYVPYQEIGEVYEPDTAFRNGTLFPELDYPFMAIGGGDCCE